MPVPALMGAIAAAAGGALVWGLLSWLTNYEIGYVAVGIGFAIGGAASKLGSRGTVAGILCAVLALAAIFCGKVLAAHLMLPTQLEQWFTEATTEEMYDELSEDAADFATLKDEAGYPEFMVSHNYSDAESADAVSPGELSQFKQDRVPVLRYLADAKPDFATWKAKQVKDLVAMGLREAELFSLVAQDLEFLDGVFALFALASAYGLAAKGPELGAGAANEQTGTPAAPAP